MEKIVPFLWYDHHAEEAAHFYVSLFKNSKVLSATRFENAGPGPGQTVSLVSFTLDGREFQALDGGPMYRLSEAFSIMVNCETQDEVDFLWEKLSEGGEKSQCGWLKDKYGLSWQIAPTALNKLLSDPDKKKANRVMKAMLKMTKIDTALLQKAYDANE